MSYTAQDVKKLRDETDAPMMECKAALEEGGGDFDRAKEILREKVPAEFKIAHDEFDAIVSFTATYTGQAVKGEIVEVSGVVEQSQQGVKRIVVGSSREAHGEYIKVIRG